MEKINQLAMKLARSETECEVIDILTEYGYWEEPSCWRYFGDAEK